ncbi:hypothetical protein BVC80_8725g5 [Macleaya cordata]|uniref:Uncharacterized protein n=1 Tax=Macleaya cordata TaxID=56857 RepID=A0A200Q8L8_MACCD|nr:hypothetical protein BVC80_8725g5 [Macleaya cordata]
MISEENLKSKVHSETGSTGGRSRKKKTARRILCQMAKAVFFDTNLKKVRNGKVVQDPIRSESSLSAKSEKISILMNEKSNRKQSEENHHWKLNPMIGSSDLSSSSSSTLTYSSSISSSSSSCSSSSWPIPESKSSWISFSGRDKSFRLNSIDKKQSNETRSSKYCCITRLSLLLFSLSVLIFWGKICAILCTSTWFYFVSTSRRDIEEEDEDDESPVMDKSPEEIIQSKEYKKKVIMEGLLERNHRSSFNLQHPQ